MKRKDYITEEKSSIEHMNDLLSKILTPANYDHIFDVPIEMWPSLPSIGNFFTSLADGSIENGFLFLYELNRSFRSELEWETNHPDLIPEIYFNSYIAKLRGMELCGFCKFMLIKPNYDSGIGESTEKIVWNLMSEDKTALDELFGWLQARIRNYDIYTVMEIPYNILKLATPEQAGNILGELEEKSEYIDKVFRDGDINWIEFMRKVYILKNRRMYNET
jgi:hypothetical protein